MFCHFMGSCFSNKCLEMYIFYIFSAPAHQNWPSGGSVQLNTLATDCTKDTICLYACIQANQLLQNYNWWLYRHQHRWFKEKFLSKNVLTHIYKTIYLIKIYWVGTCLQRYGSFIQHQSYGQEIADWQIFWYINCFVSNT